MPNSNKRFLVEIPNRFLVEIPNRFLVEILNGMWRTVKRVGIFGPTSRRWWK